MVELSIIIEASSGVENEDDLRAIVIWFYTTNFYDLII